MSLQQVSYWFAQCSEHGCDAACPPADAEVTTWATPGQAFEVAAASGWQIVGDETYCPDHWTNEDEL